MSNRTLFTIIIILAALGLIGWFLSTNGLLPGRNKAAGESGWQAVFLTNGQVYFGKLSGKGGKYATLYDIYYLQLAQAPQPDTKKNEQQQPQVSLVKLGNELHGPVDEMKINRDHVLFIEDMKNESKVVQAINNYKQSGGQTSPPPATSPLPQATR